MSLPENRRKATELPTEIIPSPNLSVYTDGTIPSVYTEGITDGIFSLVYTDRFGDGIYSLSGNTQRHGDVRRFYRRKVPRDSNCDSRTVTWRCHRQHHRRNHRRIPSVGDSVGKNHYMHPSADTLILCFSFFFFPIPPLPSQTAAKHPSQTLHYSQHEHSSFLYLVRGHNIRFL